MRTMANRLQYLLQSQSSSFYKKEAYIQEVFQNILRSASNLLARHQMPAWKDLPASKRSKMVTDILLSLEENAFLLADVTLEEQVLEEASEEIGKKTRSTQTNLPKIQFAHNNESTTFSPEWGG